MNIETITNIYLCVVLFIFGSVMGSFLECLADRRVKGLSIAKGRSFCPECGHTLGILDLFPIFSWVFLGGRCRYCKAKIPARHVIIEALTALAYLFVFIMFGQTIETVIYLLMISILIPASVQDLEIKEVDNWHFIALAVLFFATVWFRDNTKELVISGLIGGIGIPAAMLVCSLVLSKILGRDALGGADIKLLFSIGLFLGWKVSILNVLLVCIFGLAGIVITKRVSKTEEKEFPLVPAITAAAFASVMFGTQLVNAYLNLFI